jgi:hypothetical protein
VGLIFAIYWEDIWGKFTRERDHALMTRLQITYMFRGEREEGRLI